MSLIWVTAVAFALVAAGHIFVVWEVSKLRAKGIYPLKGQATINDVIRLRDSGLKTYAIRCYREIYKVSLVNAKLAVETLSN